MLRLQLVILGNVPCFHVSTQRMYRRYPKNPGWDHDHCSFCWAKFMVEDYPDVLHEGYCTLDEYHWMCRNCLEDCKNLFEWRVVPAPSADA